MYIYIDVMCIYIYIYIYTCICICIRPGGGAHVRRLEHVAAAPVVLRARCVGL